MQFPNIFLFFIFYFSIGFSSELIVPTPELPSTFDPVKSLDVYSNSAIRQIHRSLFKLSSSGEPVPDIIEDFNLDSSGKLYSFTISKLQFSDGTILSSMHVIKSLERALINKVNGFQKFSCIKGFKTFLNKQKVTLDGLGHKSETSFSIVLDCKIPRLPYLLADLRYAIVKSEKYPDIGLGDFRIQDLEKLKKNTVELESIAKNSKLSKIVYLKSSISDSMDLLLDETKNVFVYSYNFSPKQKNRMEGKAKLFEMRSWTNYFIAVNSENISNPNDRAYLLKTIDKETLVNNCYPGENADDNIFPYGFPGYIKGYQRKSERTSISPKRFNKRITITIFNGVGQENCIKHYLEKKLGKEFFIEIVATDNGISKWVQKRTDIIVFFLESELNLDVSQFFSLDAEFFLGARNDNRTFKLIEKLNSSKDATEFRKLAVEFQNSILNQNLILPLFIPKTQIAFSQNLTMPELGMIPPTYLMFKDILMEKER